MSKDYIICHRSVSIATYFSCGECEGDKPHGFYWPGERAKATRYSLEMAEIVVRGLKTTFPDMFGITIEKAEEEKE